MKFIVNECKVMEFGKISRKISEDYYFGESMLSKTSNEKDSYIILNDNPSLEKNNNMR